MTSDGPHRYIVAYDVSSDARRVRVAKLLESYGDRIQYSVFMVDAKPAKLVRLRTAVTQLLELQGDSLLICDLGPLAAGETRHLQFIGLPRSHTRHGPLVF